MICSENVTCGWLKAAAHVSDARDVVGLHVRIASPTAVDSDVVRKLDSKLRVAGCIPSNHVAATIFPEHLWQGLAGRRPAALYRLYNRPGGYYARLRRRRLKRGHADWGSYFERLSLDDSRFGTAPQLARAVAALRWRAKPRGAIHLHTGLPRDAFRPQGGPCLQIITVHVEVNDGHRAVSMCALYRNHDFFEKALGNYIGLGHLLAFLAHASHLRVGSLHVISGHAFCSRRRPVTEVLRASGF